MPAHESHAFTRTHAHTHCWKLSLESPPHKHTDGVGRRCARASTRRLAAHTAGAVPREALDAAEARRATECQAALERLSAAESEAEALKRQLAEAQRRAAASPR